MATATLVTGGACLLLLELWPLAVTAHPYTPSLPFTELTCLSSPVLLQGTDLRVKLQRPRPMQPERPRRLPSRRRGRAGTPTGWRRPRRGLPTRPSLLERTTTTTSLRTSVFISSGTCFVALRSWFSCPLIVGLCLRLRQSPVGALRLHALLCVRLPPHRPLHPAPSSLPRRPPRRTLAQVLDPASHL